ncbi:hypothetical protein Tco_1336903 [Tanacetum coccineum]
MQCGPVRYGLRLTGTRENRSLLSVTIVLHWPLPRGKLVRAVAMRTTLLGAKCRRSGRRGSWQRLGPSLTCVPTWNPTAGHKSMRASSSTCKRSTMARRLLLKKDIGFLKRTRPYDHRALRRETFLGTHFEMETSATREYPSLIHTFFLTYAIGGVFLNPENKALYDEMLRLQGLGSNTPTGVPYTEDEIMAIVHGGKQRGHIPGVGWVLPGQGTVIPPLSQSTHSTDIVRLKKREKQLTKQVNMFMSTVGAAGSGGAGVDEPGDDEDGGEGWDDS